MCVCVCVYIYYVEGLEGSWYAGEVLKVSIAMHPDIYTCIYIYIHIYIYMCVCVCVCLSVCLSICECVYTYYDEGLEGSWYAGEVLKVSTAMHPYIYRYRYR